MMNQKFSSIISIGVTDVDNRFLSADESFRLLYLEEGVYPIGQSIGFIFEDGKMVDQISSFLQKHVAFREEVIIKKRSGILAAVDLFVSRLNCNGGEMISYVITDRTQSLKAEEELRLSEERHRALYSQAYVGIARLAKMGRFLMVNDRLCQMFGFSEEELKTKTFYELLKLNDEKSSLNEWDELLSGKIENFSKEQIYMHSNGNEVFTNVTVSLVRDVKNNPSYFVAVFDDITQRKKYEQELLSTLNDNRELLREVHHRVKNNMQVISSILNLQSSFIDGSKEKMVFKDIQNRIKAMSLVHDCVKSGSYFNLIDLRSYLSQIAYNVSHSYGAKDVLLKVDVAENDMDIDRSIPLGLILNELMSNAFKHAFKSKGGDIVLKLMEIDEVLTMEIADNGEGFMKPENEENFSSLGMMLVDILVSQIGAQMEMISVPNKGTRVVINFKK